MKSKVKKYDLKKEDNGFFTYFVEFENGDSGYYICKEQNKDYFNVGQTASYKIEKAKGKKGEYNKVVREESKIDKEKTAGIGVRFANDLLIAGIIEKKDLKKTGLWFAKTIIEIANEL